MQDFENQISEEDYAHQMFCAPLISKTSQSVTVNHVFDQFGKSYQQYETTIPVDDDMTIAEVKQIYFDQHGFQNQQQFGQNTEWIIIYNLQFTLDDQMTIKELKQKINQQNFHGQFLLRVYDSSNPFFISLESCLNYQNFQQKYTAHAEIALRVEQGQQKKYIYLDEPFTQTFGQLKNKIFNQPASKNGIKFKNKNQITFRKQINAQEAKKLEKTNKIISEGLKTYLIFTDKQDKIKTRNLVKPGEVIIIKAQTNEAISIEESAYIKNFVLQIQVYVGYFDPLASKNRKSIFPKSDYSIIKVPYTKAKSMKVKTLLKQHNILNFQQTSLICEGDIILKPIQKFQKLQKSKFNLNGMVVLKCKGITQNFLFYKQIRDFSNIQNLNHKQFFDQLVQKHKKINTSQRQQCQKKVEQRRGQILDQIFRQRDFLNPIVLYTSPLVHRQLNQFARQTSPSLFNFETMAQKHWQYPFSQKLVTSLQKIPNFIGQVYRGIQGVKFTYKIGEIIQFNSWTSTSKNKKIALSFMNNGKSSKTLLKIQTFSGKQILRFSFYKKQDEVLLFPYTKFKVLRNQKIDDVQQLDLLQIPVPKKIPGDFVAWIDQCMPQNYKTFYQIIKKNNIQNLQLIQLKSNEHLQSWIKQYRALMSMLSVKLHFITNLNRTKQKRGEGIETLRIIKRLYKQANVVFYDNDIGRVEQLIKAKGFGKDQRIKIGSNFKVLQGCIVKWKRVIK